MKIAVIATYTHPSRLPVKERSVMQSAVPELIAGLCPPGAEVEIFNEKETDVPLDRHWDLVFFSYLHSYYEHTKVLSTLFRRRGMTTVAGGRHAAQFPEDCARYFDAVVTGAPEPNVPALVRDFQAGELRARYALPSRGADGIKPARWDLVDFRSNRRRLPGLEASRGCPFSCGFCVLTGHEQYARRPVRQVVDEIRLALRWNRNAFGLLEDWFMFLDNNLGGDPRYLRELCEALVPLSKTWGCAVTFNVLLDEDTVRLMAHAGCRYVYTGLESLNADSLRAMHKGQNQLSEVDAVMRRCRRHGILLSFGLLVGADGDTGEYLEALPDRLAELKYFDVTFVGIVCPYPGTPFYRQLEREGRLLPGTISRDYDGYTLCHRPARIEPTELVEHFRTLCLKLGSIKNVFRHYAASWFASRMPRYKLALLGSGSEIRSIRNPIRNTARRYVAGLDPIEAWDREMMRELGLTVQYVTAPAGAEAPRGPPLTAASGALGRNRRLTSQGS